MEAACIVKKQRGKLTNVWRASRGATTSGW
jgi:hypothetical protein